MGESETARIRIEERHRAEQQILEQTEKLQDRLARAVETGNQQSIQYAQTSIKLWEAQAVELREYIDLLEKDLIAALEEFRKKQEEIAREAERLKRIEQAVQATKQAFEDLAVAAIFEFDSIGEAAKRLARILAEDLLRILVLRPLVNAIAGAFGAPGAGAVPGAQSGGRHQGLTLVGEGGPELVDFRQPARVYNNEQLQSALSRWNSRRDNDKF